MGRRSLSPDDRESIEEAAVESDARVTDISDFSQQVKVTLGPRSKMNAIESINKEMSRAGYGELWDVSVTTYNGEDHTVLSYE